MSGEPDILRELLQQLVGSPEAEVVGVVDAGGVGAAYANVDDLWTLLFTLSGWKITGGNLNESKLTVRKDVSEASIASFMGQIRPYDVVKLRVKLAQHSVFGSPQALLVEFLDKDNSDFELAARARKLQEPVTFEDPQFGLFTLERRLDWYEAKVHWNGDPIRLTIPADDSVHSCPVAASLAVARELWANQAVWTVRITDCAISKLLALKNECWLQDTETELTAREFAERLTIESVSIAADGSFEIWHDDGDLFLGHSISVRGSIEEGPKAAVIEG